MEQSRLLLLDAGPIIKLFELGLWEQFLQQHNVTIARTVVDEVIYTGQGDSITYIDFPFEQAAAQGRLRIIDVAPSTITSFLQDSRMKRYAIDPGEAETLVFFLKDNSRRFAVCSADGSVFRLLGLLGKAEGGISLEELLGKAGLRSLPLERKFTKKFREQYTKMGWVDLFQSGGHAQHS